MTPIFRHELLVQNRIHNLIKYSLVFFIFCSLSASLISSHEFIKTFGVIFYIISIPLAFIGISAHLLKSDMRDGTLETMLATSSALKITLAKYFALCICFASSMLLSLPLIYILYEMSVELLLASAWCAFMLITLGAALILLISTIQSYFQANTNFLSILIMPIIIPNIILTGILIQAPTDFYIGAIMLGINLFLIPPALYLASYLLENIYNMG